MHIFFVFFSLKQNVTCPKQCNELNINEDEQEKIYEILTYTFLSLTAFISIVFLFIYIYFEKRIVKLSKID